MADRETEFTPTDASGCFACQTVQGTRQAPGGVVYETEYWLVDHCVGPFGIGAMVLKTKAHREALWQLTSEEANSLGPILKLVSEAIIHVLGAERTYVSLWVDQPPYHVHWVIQPRYANFPATIGIKGLKYQWMRSLLGRPDPNQAAQAAQQVRDYLQQSSSCES